MLSSVSLNARRVSSSVSIFWFCSAIVFSFSARRVIVSSSSACVCWVMCFDISSFSCVFSSCFHMSS